MDKPCKRVSSTTSVRIFFNNKRWVLLLILYLNCQIIIFNTLCWCVIARELTRITRFNLVFMYWIICSNLVQSLAITPNQQNFPTFNWIHAIWAQFCKLEKVKTLWRRRIWCFIELLCLRQEFLYCLSCQKLKTESSMTTKQNDFM